MTHRFRLIGTRLVLGCLILAACFSSSRLAGQNPGGTIISGPNPWIDVTAPPYNAQCNGSTDDTAAIQSALAVANTAGFGRIFIPYTGQPCIVMGYSSGLASGYSISNSGGTMKIPVATAPASWVKVGAPLAVFGTSGCTGGYGTNLGCNGVWLISGLTPGTPYYISVSVPSTLAGSPSSATVSVGLWTDAIVDIEGQCTTRQNSAACSKLSTPSSPTTDSPIYILSSVPNGTPPGTNTFSVRHLNFSDGYNSSGTALGGIYAFELNGFEISDDNFQYFNPSGEGIQAGAGITLDGGSSSGFVENGYVVNNKFYDTIYPVTIRNKLSGTLFLMNHAVCTNASNAVITNSVAFDLGYEWNAVGGSTGSTGGENTLFANQVEGCTIGYILDNQNDDNVISKAEMTSTMTGTTNSIGFDVLSGQDVWLDMQTKNYSTGVHVDTNSSGVHFTNPRISGANQTETITSDGGSFQSASIYVEPGAQPTMTVVGLGNPETSAVGESLTTNSTYWVPACSPMDTTCFQYTQDFCSNAGSNAVSLGFSLTTISGGTPSLGLATASANFPCGIAVTTPATSGEGASYTLSSGNPLGPLGNTSANWSAYLIASVGSTTSIGARWGFGTGGSTSAIPTNGFYLRYDTSLSDTKYEFCVDVSSTETCNSTGQTPSASTFVVLRIINVAAGEISMSLYSAGSLLTNPPTTFCASGCTVNTAPPTANLTAYSSVVARASTAETMTLEKLAFVEWGLSR